jgi:hypothetical protein
MRRGLSWLWLPLLVCWLTVPRARAISLDEEGTIQLNVRAYTNLRVSTMAAQSTRPANGASSGPTYPYSGAFHVMQNRYFLEVQWDHDLLPLLEDYLPGSISDLSYNLTYRGEYEGIYDYGPKEYSHATESRNDIEQALRNAGYPTDSANFTLYRLRHRLREVASYRNRLFQAFLDYEQGPVFVRFGRQNLAWGETDIFRLLDNINPIDNSFGGFFIDLDERRVPLDMLRMSYFIGSLGPLEQAFLEGYAALDTDVAFVPGAPAGSPWAAPLGTPIGLLLYELEANPRNFDHIRGGARFVFNYADFTFTLASYQTILDLPAVSFRPAAEADNGFTQGISLITADVFGPLVWVNGASMSTAIPSLKAILRSELAYFVDEATFSGPTPAAFPGKGLTTQFIDEFLAPVAAGEISTVTKKDTINFAIGWDMNRNIPQLNANQSFFFTTQFFLRHVIDAQPLLSIPVPQPNNSLRSIPYPQTTLLHTFLVNTTYNTRIPGTDTTVQTTPGFAMFYDWQGMLLFQPSLRFVRDPWRFIIDYTTINSGVFRYQIGLVRDRSNIRAQIEYVL